MKNKKNKIFRKLIFIVISIIIASNGMKTTSQADVVEAVKVSSQISKQAVENPYEDKPYSDEYLKWLSLSDEERIENYGEVIPIKEFIAVHLNEEENTKEEEASEQPICLAENSEQNTAQSLPSTYKISNLKVEDQGSSAWCWAYSTLKCLETYLQKNKNINYNLAEYHLAYMRCKFFDGWKEVSKDGFESYGEAAYNLGGNYSDFMKYVGVYSSEYSIKGPIIDSDSNNKTYMFTDENKTNFKSKTQAIKVTKVKQFSYISKSYANDGTVTYKNGNTTLTKQQISAFRNEVKQQIKDNGGVETSTNIDDNYFNNSTNALYINTNNISQNHSVTIVGWDDNYSKTNFKSGKQPKSNGAWIALNSWGEEWGDDGYFYISYDDALVEKFMMGVVDAEKYNQTPSATVKYSTKDYTSGDVTVTIESNERLEKPSTSGWSISYQESYSSTYGTITTTATTLKKTYTSNTKETITLKDVSGNEVTKEIVIENIDKEGPTLQGGPSQYPIKKTNSGVTVTLPTIIDKGVGLRTDKKTYSYDLGETWETENKHTYSTNGKKEIWMRDKLGNITKISLKINNIDKTAPELVVNYSPNTATTGKVLVKITANEQIQEIGGWTLSEDKLTLTKSYSTNGAETVVIKDIAGNEVSKKISVQNIIMIGDINQNKKIDISDLLLLKRHLIAGSNKSWVLTGNKLKAADINEGEKVNITDLLLLKRLLLKNTV